MRKIVEMIRTHFILKMIMAAMCLLIVPGLIVLFLSYYINYQSLNKYMSNMNQWLIKVHAEEWEKSLELIMGLPNELYKTNNARVMQGLRKKTAYESEEIAAIDSMLSNMLLKSDGILGIDITGNNGYTIREYRFISQSRWQTFAEQMELKEGINTFVQDGEMYFGAYHVTLTDFPSYDMLAEVNVYFSFDEWTGLAVNLGGQQDDYAVCLLDEEENILFEYGDKGAPDLALADGVYHQYKGVMGETPGYYYMEKIIVAGIPFRLIKFLPKSVITGIVCRVVLPVALVDVFLLVLMFLYLFSLYVSVMRPIKRIADNMKKVQSGIFSYKASGKSRDEIGQMDQQYEKMVMDIDYLINQKMRSEIEITKSKLKMLQAQINPHFLNNILQTISTEALCEEAPQTNKMICSLARMLQYNMEVDKEVVCLEEEVTNIRHYLKLQNQRYQNRIICDIEQDEESGFVRVPKMILQPLVENAIKYSKLKNGEECHLEVNAYVQNKLLYLKVSDDGQGISEEKKAEIRYLYTENEMNVMNGHGIGFLNVLFRLKIFYKDRFAWEIQDNHPGCMICLMMPTDEQEGMQEDESIGG